MRAARSFFIFRQCVKLVFVVLVFSASASNPSKSTPSLTVSGTKSTNSETLSSSRYKRAPGWGKRAPGWGKRQSLNDEFFDDFDSTNDISATVALYKPNDYLSDDSLSSDNNGRGYGKQYSSQDMFSSVLDSDLDVTVPHWVKRSIDTEQVDEFTQFDKRVPGWGKRAPGWGKRAPGWGKRAPGWGKRASGWGKRAPGWGKRAPGWGKRAPGWGKRAPGWGKRSPGWGKRAPGWGKRAPGWGKRAPGWGKRDYQIDLESDGIETRGAYDAWDSNKHNVDENLIENLDSAEELIQELTNGNEALGTVGILPGNGLTTEKKAPGWGKRAPGWGKRDYLIELNKEDNHLGKRVSGWGKRAPGWGKRAPGWGKRDYENPLEDAEVDKRAPGWGKRASIRVKRALTKHIAYPADDICQELESSKNELLARLKELAAQRSFRGGRVNVVNKPYRK